MFVNFKRETVLEQMEKSEFVFHLTGSRFFGTHGPESDYDFFVQSSESVRDWLIAAGFNNITPSSKYKDFLTLYVWRKGDVDVQMVKNADLKARAQENMLRVTKYPTKYLWELAFRFLGYNP